MSTGRFVMFVVGFLMGIIAVISTRQETLAQDFSLNRRVNEPAPGTDGPEVYTRFSITTDSQNNIHITWMDDRNRRGNFDVYYAKSIDGGQTFLRNVRVDDTGTGISIQQFPTLAVDGDGNIHVTWMDNRNGNWDIYYAKSTDGGQTFLSNVRVDDTGASTSKQEKPSIAVDERGHIHIAWMDNRNGTHDIYYTKSTNGGQTFISPNIRVDDTGNQTSIQYHPFIAVVAADGGWHIHITWVDDRNGNWDIYYAKSTDDGQTFFSPNNPNVRVDDTGNQQSFQMHPCIAVDGVGHIHVAWMDNRHGNYDIYYAKSEDGGRTFLSNVRVDDTGTGASKQHSPLIAVDASRNIHVTWVDKRNDNPDIYYAKSTDGGQTFFSPDNPNVRVDDTGAATSAQKKSSIAVDRRGHIHITWMDNRNGNWDIYYTKSTDGGRTFHRPDIRVDDAGYAASAQESPSITVDGAGNIHATWVDKRNGNSDIYYAKSTDGGRTFLSNVRVDDTGAATSIQEKPSIAMDERGHIHITWMDNRNGNYDIYYAKSTDGGQTFLSNVRVDDTGAATSTQERPSIAVDRRGHIHITWMDNRDGNYDIYYAKSTDGGQTFLSNVRVDDTGDETSAQESPSIDVDAGGIIHVAWADTRNGNYDIYYANSTDDGQTFLRPNARVDDTGAAPSFQMHPSIAVDARGHIHIAWTDTRNGNYDIYYANSMDGGQTFLRPNARVDDTGAAQSFQINPTMAVDGSRNIHIVWCDNRNGNDDVYYTRSIDGGATFLTSVRVDDTGTGTSSQLNPSVAVDGSGHIHVAWTDFRNGWWNADIYYSKTDGGVTEVPVVGRGNGDGTCLMSLLCRVWNFSFIGMGILICLTVLLSLTRMR